MSVPLSIALLLGGLICTSRLIISNHSDKEIYTGLMLGVLCQLAADIVV
jgi:membrane-associated phospholipid phosphatase